VAWQYLGLAIERVVMLRAQPPHIHLTQHVLIALPQIRQTPLLNRLTEIGHGQRFFGS
jgi:hypothetical protein